METVKSTLAENLGGPAHNLASGDQAFSIENDVPDLSGKVALVTGGSEGIGFGCTHTLIKHNVSKLFILSQREEVVEDALKAIDEEFGQNTSQKIIWLKCDLSDWDQTAQTATKILDETDKIDIIINNAARGIMTQQFAPSNGIDLHMAANHMGHVVLTSHLLPLVKKTANAGNTVRIVNLASNAHQNAPKDTAFASLD
ncbi:retinol dehydrogenase 12, partial [Hortaea werneckii]